MNVKSVPSVSLQVRVQPASSKAVLGPWDGETLHAKLTAPRQKGKANQQLIELLAKTLGLKRSQIQIISGEKARLKRLRLLCVSEEELKAALQILNASKGRGLSL